MHPLNLAPLFLRLLLISVVSAVFQQPAAWSDDDAEPRPETTKGAELLQGHSEHGEAFNEGPRQAAYLMDGLENVSFDATTSSEEAKAFVRQGVAQLHGFWFFESERSFRQAAMFDPNCAIAYWGMAMSNRKNADRAKGFISKATERKTKASQREKMLIESFDAYINAKTETPEEKRKRALAYANDLDDIIIAFPDDVEPKAILAEFLWSARKKDLKIASYSTINALIQSVLDVAPLHPIHHYRIHLWDKKKPELALESAARCGLAAPAIAHMWHMPGHIYSRLKRYGDAVYQQEASARVDHAHMMKDHVLPDQIHNFAHNNEWCIRNMVHIGRVTDAIHLAKNMIELPRHPKYNHIGKSGSYKYGRKRLLDVLRTYQRHDEIVALAETPYLEHSGDDEDDVRRDRYVASALAAVGKTDDARKLCTKIEELLVAEELKQREAGDKAEQAAIEKKEEEKAVEKSRSAAERKFKKRIDDLQKAIDEINGRLAQKEGRLEEALELYAKAEGVPVEEQVMVMLAAGKQDDAVKKIADHVRVNKNEVRPLAAEIEVLWAAERKEEAAQKLTALSKLSSSIDRSVPAFRRLDEIAEALSLKEDWIQPVVVAADIGARPPLDSLGPFRWQPTTGADWTLKNVDNKDVSLRDFRGKPVVMIFFLGAGCLHCAEQLQAFAPNSNEYGEAGIQLVAVSSDAQSILKKAHDNLDDGIPFPLVSDAELNVFKSYRCFDDFEQKTLHGTFLLDADGRVRWQDISYEPFMDPDFVLKEAKRLLQQDQHRIGSDADAVTTAD